LELNLQPKFPFVLANDIKVRFSLPNPVAGQLPIPKVPPRHHSQGITVPGIVKLPSLIMVDVAEGIHLWEIAAPGLPDILLSRLVPKGKRKQFRPISQGTRGRSIDFNRISRHLNGSTLNPEEILQRRQREGLCVSCADKLFTSFAE